MTRYLLSIAIVALITLAEASPSPTNAAERSDEDASKAAFSEIAAAWKAREAKIRSGEFEWTEVRVRSYSRSKKDDDPFAPGPGTEPKGTVTDRKTIRHQYRCSLLFKGEKLRSFSDEPSLFVPEGRWFSHKSTRAYDGRVFQGLDDTGVAGTPGHEGMFRQTGWIRTSGDDDISCMLAYEPVLLHFRPYRCYTDFISRLQKVPREGFDGKRCTIVETALDPEGHTPQFLLLDPEQGYCIRRRVWHTGTLVKIRIDITYTVDPAYGPVPKSWRIVTHFLNGEFDRSIEATVTTARLNHQIAHDRFVIEFPVNTFVSDATQSNGREPQRYVVRPGGGKRIVLPAERRKATAEQLIRTETGGALPDAR